MANQYLDTATLSRTLTKGLSFLTHYLTSRLPSVRALQYGVQPHFFLFRTKLQHIEGQDFFVIQSHHSSSIMVFSNSLSLSCKFSLFDSRIKIHRQSFCTGTFQVLLVINLPFFSQIVSTTAPNFLELQKASPIYLFFDKISTIYRHPA